MTPNFGYSPDKVQIIIMTHVPQIRPLPILILLALLTLGTCSEITPSLLND